MDCITEKGLLLSEYPPGIRLSIYTFPRKNRLINAWEDRIIVITPGKGKEALITEEYGKICEIGRNDSYVTLLLTQGIRLQC